MKNRFEKIIGNFDPSLPTPQIDPVPEGVKRPLWSVMIPTFNCAKYLETALESVLCQDPGSDKMQIQVVDDCSTKDDPEEITKQIGAGRVEFHRNKKNLGSCSRNFNICIQKSRGHLVHILHGDDFVCPTFYKKFEKMVSEYPNLAFFGARSFFVDKEDVIFGVSPIVLTLEKPSNENKDFFYQTCVQASAAVVKRSFYEKFGGFNETLAHTADCEMWARSIFDGGGIISKEVLSFYRVFPENDTSKNEQNGNNIKDYLRLNYIFKHKYKKFCFEKAFLVALNKLVSQIERFEINKNEEGVKNNNKLFKEISPFKIKLKNAVIKTVKQVKQKLIQ